MSRMQPLLDLVMRFPVRLALVNLLIIFAVAAGGSRLAIESGIRVLFSPEDPNLLAEIDLEDTFGKEDNILLVLDAGEGDVFQQHLALLADMTAKAWQIPHSRRVDSATNFLHTVVDGDDIAIGPLVEGEMLLSADDVERLRHIALREDLLVGRLIAGNGKVAAINVSLALAQTDKAQALADAVQAARQIASDAMAQTPDVHVHLVGLALTEQNLAEVTAADGATLIPLVFVMVLLVLALLLRSLMAALCTVITIALSVVVGMGFAGWMGIAINSVSISAPTIIMTLAVADCVHLLSSFLRQLRSGVQREAAVRAALDETVYPIFLTSVTTAIGFLSMNFSDSPPFRELGTISAVGLLGALWVTVTILPALLLKLPFRATWRELALPMSKLATLVICHQRRMFWGMLLVMAGVLSFVPRIELNDDPAGYFSDDVPLTSAISIVEEKLSGTQNVHYKFDSQRVDGVTDPEFLQQVGRFVDWLRVQPEVTNVETFTDTLKRLNQVMHEDDPTWYRLPEQQDLAAQYVLLYEISIPYGQDVTYQVSADKSALKVTAVLRNQKSRVVQFEQRSRDWLQENAPALVTRGTGHAVSFAHIGMRNIQSMLIGSLFAILLVSACLVLAFRSWRFGLVSLVPNLFPALLALGVWSALVQEVNMAASVVFSMTLGIVVDDTTHFLVKYRDARVHRGLSAADAIVDTFTTVGRALVATTIVLAAGFLILVQSDFSVNATSGMLMSLTIVIALLLDLLFLPALLLRVDRWLIPGSPAEQLQ